MSHFETFYIHEHLLNKFGLLTAAVYGVIQRDCLENFVCSLTYAEIGHVARISAKSAGQGVKALMREGYIRVHARIGKSSRYILTDKLREETGIDYV